MNHYFVDYENIHQGGIQNLNIVNENDFVYLIYTEHSKNITLDLFELAQSKKINIIPLKVSVGSKNALDFQLSTYLGYVIGKNKNNNDKYFIVAKDGGYDRICEFWRDRAVSIKRITSLSNNHDNVNKTKEKPKKVISGIITEREILKYLSKDEYQKEMLDIFNQCKTKREIHNGLSKQIKDSEKTKKIYLKLKPLFEEKNK